MSFKALDWAFNQSDISPVQKLVLICLADCHNGATGDCYPTVSYLVKRSNTSDKTVRRALIALEEAGLITRHRPDATSSYAFDLHTGQDDQAGQSDRGGRSERPGGPVRESKRCIIEPEVNRKLTGGGTKRPPRPTVGDVEAYAYEYANSKGKPVSATFAERWHGYYQGNGWKVGKNPMKDWKATVRNWLLKDWENPSGGNGATPDYRTSPLRHDDFRQRHTDLSWADGLE